MILTINRNKLEHGIYDIELMIADLIKRDLNAKNVKVVCKIRNWRGHTCPVFWATADGVALLVHGEVSQYDLDIDPWVYDMEIYYDLR